MNLYKPGFFGTSKTGRLTILEAEEKAAPLFAEIERLRAAVAEGRQLREADEAEIKRLRAIVAEAQRGPRIWHEAQDKIKTERDRLREALEHMIETLADYNHPDQWTEAILKARKALEGKNA